MTLKERIKSEMMVIKSLGVVYGDIGTKRYGEFVLTIILPIEANDGKMNSEEG